MNLKTEYKEAWKFMKSCKTHFLVMIIIFVLTTLIGFLFPVFFVDYIKELLKEIFANVENLSGMGLIIFIIQNNLITSLVGVIAGVVFGIVPLLTGVFNGYVLGFVSRFAVEESGVRVLWSLAPHGIFELPALIISLGLGLKIGTGMFSKKKTWKILKENFANALRVFVLVVIPLLIIAGIIEGVLISVLG